MKNYALAIGGSGARCLESLIHFCAAGLGPDELFILIVDSDEANGNVQRLRDVVTKYHACRQQLGYDRESPIFKTNIEWSIDGDRDFLAWSPDLGEKKLRKYLKVDNLVAAPKGSERQLLGDMARLLYSQAELDLEWDLGFRGRCSVGAPVMARIKESLNAKPWYDLLQSLRQRLSEGGDARLFVLASIFGATGAAGFPTVAKILRDESQTWPNNQRFFLGGGLLLPYFSFNSPPGQKGLYARSEDFLLNTKAALKHYSFVWKDDGPYDATYFIGDRDPDSARRQFALGGTGQRNHCHYVEWLAALAANNFYGKQLRHEYPDDEPLQGERAAPVKGRNESYYAGRANEHIDWTDLPDENLRTKLLSFTTFAYANKVFYAPLLALEVFEKKAQFAPWYVDHFSRAQMSLSTDQARSAQRSLGDYLTTYLEWMTQTHLSSETQKLRLLNTAVLQSSRTVGPNDQVDFLTMTEDNFRRLLYSDADDPACRSTLR